MHLTTMLPAIVDALHDEAVAIAGLMRDLTLRQSLVAKGEKPAPCPNLAATSLVMRIVFINESLTELRGALAAGLPVAPRKPQPGEPLVDRYLMTGGFASAALRELAARQEAIERRYGWLCRALVDDRQAAQGLLPASSISSSREMTHARARY